MRAGMLEDVVQVAHVDDVAAGRTLDKVLDLAGRRPPFGPPKARRPRRGLGLPKLNAFEPLTTDWRQLPRVSAPFNQLKPLQPANVRVLQGIVAAVRYLTQGGFFILAQRGKHCPHAKHSWQKGPFRLPARWAERPVMQR